MKKKTEDKFVIYTDETAKLVYIWPELRIGQLSFKIERLVY